MRSKMRWTAGIWNFRRRSSTAETNSGRQLEMRELVTIRQFRDLPEALLAKGSLESAGIACFLADENMVRLDWFISNFVGGVKLMRRRGCRERAEASRRAHSRRSLCAGNRTLRAAALSAMPVAGCELPGVGSAHCLHERFSARADSCATASLALPCLRCGVGRRGNSRPNWLDREPSFGEGAEHRVA